VIDELTRTVKALGFFYAGLPFVARRAAKLTQAEARRIAIAHAARARRLADIELVVEGADHVPERGPFVLIYNESSFAQDLANLEVLARFGIDHVVLAAEYAAVPYIARAAKTWGIVFLHRGHREEVERTLAGLVAALRAGERVSIAPQGRVSPDGGVCHFKRGAFLVAIRAGVPIVPVGIGGGADILAPRSLRMRPGVLSYRVGEPISTVGRTEADAPSLADHAREIVTQLAQR
jgi:1-acyl-sn-glycerol-3-phosphate acyltransferase